MTARIYVLKVLQWLFDLTCSAWVRENKKPRRTLISDGSVIGTVYGRLFIVTSVDSFLLYMLFMTVQLQIHFGCIHCVKVEEMFYYILLLCNGCGRHQPNHPDPFEFAFYKENETLLYRLGYFYLVFLNLPCEKISFNIYPGHCSIHLSIISLYVGYALTFRQWSYFSFPLCNIHYVFTFSNSPPQSHSSQLGASSHTLQLLLSYYCEHKNMESVQSSNR